MEDNFKEVMLSTSFLAEKNNLPTTYGIIDELTLSNESSFLNKPDCRTNKLLLFVEIEWQCDRINLICQILAYSF